MPAFHGARIKTLFCTAQIQRQFTQFAALHFLRRGQRQHIYKCNIAGCLVVSELREHPCNQRVRIDCAYALCVKRHHARKDLLTADFIEHLPGRFSSTVPIGYRQHSIDLITGNTA